MAHNIAVDFQAFDFDGAVDEVDVMVPKYLDALQSLEEVERVEEIPMKLETVVTYWTRLTTLMQHLEEIENKIPFDEIKKNSLQSELTVLEKIYLSVNLRIEFTESQWTKTMWHAADTVLNRMDIVLEGLGFEEDHDDRLLVRELKANNQLKEQRWLRRLKFAC